MRKQNLVRIEPDDELAKQFGFISDHFKGWMYKRGNSIWVAFIISKFPRKGNFRRMVQKILALGFVVKIPTPFPTLRNMLLKQNYVWKKTYWRESKEYIEYFEKRPSKVERFIEEK